MSLPVTYTCPLGSECEKVVDGGIERCRWFITVKGTNPQTGEETDSQDCAMAWQPLLLINIAKETNTVSESVTSMRNETIKRQDTANLIELQRQNDGQKVITSN